MLGRIVRRGASAARAVVRAAKGLVLGPEGPGAGTAEFQDFARLRQEAAEQDRREGIRTAGSEMEAIADGTKEIGAEELRVMLEVEDEGERPILVDVREAHEWKQGHLKGAVHVPLGRLDEAVTDIDRNRKVVLYCASGKRSIDGSYVLKRHGFPRVQSLAGGIAAWSRAGNEVVGD
jgi:rhodanese-related sulfurtransferase